jgi:hypothetical protein
MKKLIRVFALIFTLNIVFAVFPAKISAQQNDVNFQEFYDQLSPYGQWIDDYNYGYVWIPDVNQDFTPYLTNGYWQLTDYGWMWISDYDWGWAAFHYGRWDYNDSYGWFWVPDNEWGPSWVTWRRSGNYYGWAPMRPGISISISFGSYNNIPNNRWTFVRDRDIERHNIDRNFVDPGNNINIIKNSTVINKTYYDGKRHSTYVAGPSRDDVQKMAGRTIKPFTVNERDKPGQSINKDQVQIYRPQVQKNNNGHKPVPNKLANIKDVKRIQVKEVKNQPLDIQKQNNKTGNRHQQPPVNLQNKTNRTEDPPTQSNTGLRNNNTKKVEQPVVNPIIKKGIKNKTYQPMKLDPIIKENKIIVPKKLDYIDRTNNAKKTNPPKKSSKEQSNSKNDKEKKQELK